jgi:hypothetical protein
MDFRFAHGLHHPHDLPSPLIKRGLSPQSTQTGETTMIAFLAIIVANVAILGVVALCDPYRD